jgi:hypothetical protein
MTVIPEGTLPLVASQILSPYSYELAASNKRILVGYPDETEGGIASSGAVYAFHRTSDGKWAKGQRLIPKRTLNADASKAMGPYFGNSISLQDGRAVIGSWAESGGPAWSGAAYVFSLVDGKWTQEARLSQPSPTSKDYFGWSVALSPDRETAFVGSIGDDEKADNTGSVFVFKRQPDKSWKLIRTLAPSSRPWGNVGTSVATDGVTLAIGATGEGVGADTKYPAYPTGQVYALSGSEFTQTQTIVSPAPQAMCYFGWKVAVDGDILAVAAPFTDDAARGKDIGVVHLYKRAGSLWSFAQTIRASDAGMSDSFGHSLDLAGNVLVVGNRTPYSGPKYGQAVAYVFERTNGLWTQRERLAPTEVRTKAPQVGTRVAMDSDSIVMAGSTGPAAAVWGH